MENQKENVDSIPALPELTRKQGVFVKEYLETGNGTQAALRAYDTESLNTAASIASENLRKPNVRAYLEAHADQAAINIVELANNADNETVRLNANKDILDRAGFKPIEKTDVTSGGKPIFLPSELAEKNNINLNEV